ncbi:MULTISPECIES: prephenate dehydratase domain-containing protein [Streptomyces]|uniref:Prephenate dehydratase domain-containing protein n=1 Tax=Streptomyces canarius TaxID=285453 RepID=A0ABQ3D3W1_9ACTN|nr:prephenate dehydratase domain-containing protein [Streptomyces canarius]GHA54471.1 hypothetical protein GCM10010345_68890 [Streptomyces canarius]
MILGDADVAVIPVDNSAPGRVADVHHLLPDSDLHSVAEYFLPIRFDLMGVAGGTLNQVEYCGSSCCPGRPLRPRRPGGRR